MRVAEQNNGTVKFQGNKTEWEFLEAILYLHFYNINSHSLKQREISTTFTDSEVNKQAE